MSLHTFHGNFFVRSTDLLSLPNVNPDHGYTINIAIDENLKDMSTVCFQAALLYTSSRGGLTYIKNVLVYLLQCLSHNVFVYIYIKNVPVTERVLLVYAFCFWVTVITCTVDECRTMSHFVCE